MHGKKDGEGILSRVKDWISSLWAWIIPRPRDVVAKLWFFVYGMLAALIIGGFNGDQFSAINRLFGSALPWRNESLPLWAIAVFLLTYVVLEELLLQQAKLIWDDVRDKDRDKKLLQNKERAIARGKISTVQAIWNMLLRLGVVVVFLAWQARTDLLLIFGMILFHQAVYLWAKPRGARHPLLVLLWLSFNNALRFLAGVVAVIGWQPLFPLSFLFVVFYFCSFGGLAVQWKMEAEYAGNVRPQSAYFLMKGNFWQHVGLINALLVSFLLFFVPLRTVQLSWLALGGVSLGMIGIFLLFGMTLVHTFQKAGMWHLISQKIKHMKSHLLLFFGCVGLGISSLLLSCLFFAFMKLYAMFLIFGLLLVINIMYLILYEKMTYLEFTSVIEKK